MAGKKFRFSLASVLKLREYEADHARDQLARAVRDRDAAGLRVAEAESALHELVEEARERAIHEIGVLLRSEAARSQATARLEQAKAQFEAAFQTEQDQRAHLSACMQAKEALENLKATELERYWEEDRYTDQAALDEQGFIGFLQKRQKAHS